MSREPARSDDLDPALVRAWREASGEQPPEPLDDAIRAAARRAVHAGPRPAGAPLTHRWRVPLSIAALVVISASVTLMISRHDAHLPVPGGEAGTAATREQAAPLAKQATPDEHRLDQAQRRAPPASPPAALMPSQRGADAPAQTEARQEAASPARPAPEAAPAASRNEQPSASDVAPPTPAAVPAGELPAPDANVRGFRAEPSRELSRTGPEASRQGAPPAGATPAEPGVAAERESGAEVKSLLRESEPPEDSPQPAGRARLKLQTRPAAPAHPAVEDDASGALLPERWIEEIRELRRRGEATDAEASLKAFRERYPDYALPDDLLAPH